MDPVLAALGLNYAAGLGVEASKLVANALREWARSDDVTRLFAALEKRFADVPGVSRVALSSLRTDEPFLRALFFYWQTGEFPRNEVRAALARHLGPTESQTAEDLASDVADYVQRLSPKALGGGAA